MILQALTEYYRVLADRGVLEAPGWSSAKISFALCLSADGTLEQVISLQTEQPRGKENWWWRPQLVPSLPAPVKRSSGVSANFLWDNASYLLGMDNKGKPQRSLACFSAAKELHETLAAGAGLPGCPGPFGLFPHLIPRKGSITPPYRTNWKTSSPAATCCFGTRAGLSTRTLPFAKPGKPTTTPRARGPRESAWSPENGGPSKAFTRLSNM